jgi:NAD(P)-dependent dehydrogenase (short-subunit alcohol dehydrogenase family)
VPQQPVIVVTGASGGVGRAVVRAFAKRGSSVGLLARGELGLKEALNDVERCGATGLAVPTDMSRWAQVETAADRIERELGPIDVWINVAFSSVFGPVQDIRPEEFERVTAVSYLGYVYGTKAALERMRPRDHGTVVQVGSALAYRGIPLQSAYCGAKHAIQGFNEAVRCELLHDHSRVHVTMVQLPAVNTPQFTWLRSRMHRQAQPVPPIYQPEVAARAIVYAADHPRRREYWVGGSTAATLMANALAPGLLDRYLARTGFDSQQTDAAHDPRAKGNLMEPADGRDGHDYGAHGIFDVRSTSRSWQLWASQHHGSMVAAGAAALTLPVLGAAARRRSAR